LTCNSESLIINELMNYQLFFFR